MKKRSAIHICLVGGLILLIAQLGLLVLLLYPYNQHRTYILKDVGTLVNITSKLHMSLFAVDSEVLQNFINTKNEIRKQCILCETRYPATFITLFRGIRQSGEFVAMLEDAKFHVVVLQNTNPPEVPSGISINIPICYLLKRNTVIHLVLFHEREGNYWWHGNLLSDPKAIPELSALGLSVHGVQMMKTEGAFDKFETELVHTDGVPMLIPKDIPRFLREASCSRFIECNHMLADSFHRAHGKDTTHEALRFVHRAWKLLSRAKTLLDKLGVRFWISSGTCLGYFRQCDIIPYSKDVDIGIFITDYSEQIVPEFLAHGFTLKHWFGKVNDSLELSFSSGDLKLDIFFFYEDGRFIWNGGTQAKSGKKFKYIFPRFTLCWTEFLELKVRVPCETQAYIESNYGSDWFTPVTRWDWKSSPPNVRENGEWPAEEWPQVMRVYN
ncbi:ribitol-5-phosphate transferase FKTN-like [Periplaneta americana]|uniref:ribitol-5-phosphate transferase FKTN-like n=1 Tax=Periplaneta americana TaxID=6978 RepID=UPI0037E7B144